VPDSGQARSFVIKQIGGFVFKKLSAFSRQPSVFGFLPFAFCPCLFLLFLPTADALCPANGGFVPDSGQARSFIIKQIGGFVFQKALSFQPSASGFPEPSRLFLCRLPS